ncbi:MAG: 1-acyl-sn-glycerol-3-phosphate acyltransferase [Parvularculaceae bacterium]
MEAKAAQTAPAVGEKHIVEVLIEERAPKLVASPFWPLYRAVLYPLLRAPAALRMADAIEGKSGREVMDFMSELLALKLTVSGAENVPHAGRLIVAPVHPTGIADGIAMYEALKPLRPDQIYFANRDAIRVSGRLADVLIPVEWVAAKRTRQRSRETLLAANAAFDAERCVVLFPSGRLAFMDEKRVLTEQEWQPSISIFARKYDCAVVPAHIEARNSWLYYWFRGLNPELRDITLFNELLNKKGSPFHITFGKPIPASALQGDPAEVAERLRLHAWKGVPQGAQWMPPADPDRG